MGLQDYLLGRGWGAVEVKNPLHLFVEQPAAFGAAWAGQTDQGVAASDADRNATVEQLVSQELWNMAAHQPDPEEGTRNYDREDQDQVERQLADRYSKPRNGLAKHQGYQKGESGR